MVLLPQGLEEGMGRVCSVPGSFVIILDGQEGPRVQGDAPEFLAFADLINDGLFPVGLEIRDSENGLGSTSFPHRYFTCFSCQGMVNNFHESMTKGGKIWDVIRVEKSGP